MAKYRISNKEQKAVNENEFDEFVGEFWGEEYFKSYFKSDGFMKNRMYMLQENKHNVCRIDACFAPYKTVIGIYELEEKGIEKLLTERKNFTWKKK